MKESLLDTDIFSYYLKGNDIAHILYAMKNKKSILR